MPRDAMPRLRAAIAALTTSELESIVHLAALTEMHHDHDHEKAGSAYQRARLAHPDEQDARGLLMRLSELLT